MRAIFRVFVTVQLSAAMLLTCVTTKVVAQATPAQLVDDALSATVLDPTAYVRAVLAVNPSLEVAEHSFRAARARERQSGKLADPMVHGSIAPLSVAPSHHRLGFEIGISQELPWFGNLGAERRVMEAESQAMQRDVETARRELAISARQLYAQYYVAVRSQDINAQHMTLVNALKDTVARQLSDGRGSTQDLLQTESQLANLERDALILQSEREVVVAQLNALLRRAPEARLPPPLAELRRPAERPAAPPLPAAEVRSEIQAVAARARGESLKGEAAARAYYPSFKLSTSYSSMWDMPSHRWMIGVDLNVPWPSERKSAAIDEARAMQARYRSEIAQLSDAARTELFVAARRLSEAEQVLTLLETRHLPIATEQIAVARAAFMASRASLLSVLEAERSLRSVELERELMRAECDRRELAVRRALGRLPVDEEVQR